jgi:hypothetical protein
MNSRRLKSNMRPSSQWRSQALALGLRHSQPAIVRPAGPWLDLKCSDRVRTPPKSDQRLARRKARQQTAALRHFVPAYDRCGSILLKKDFGRRSLSNIDSRLNAIAQSRFKNPFVRISIVSNPNSTASFWRLFQQHRSNSVIRLVPAQCPVLPKADMARQFMRTRLVIATTRVMNGLTECVMLPELLAQQSVSKYIGVIARLERDRP